MVTGFKMWQTMDRQAQIYYTLYVFFFFNVSNAYTLWPLRVVATRCHSCSTT